MLIEDTLIQCGFEKKEALVYIALLELGMEKVQAIASKAKIKRSTTYVILEQLNQKNYVTKTINNKKIYYSAVNPEIILKSFHHKEEALGNIMPLLKARIGANKYRPKIKIYEGRGGIERVYQEIYESPAVSFFGSISNLSEELSDLIQRHTKIIKSKNISVRDLITTDPKDIDFAAASLGNNYEGRIVPKEVSLLVDGAIFGDKVAILSIKKDFFAVVIESTEVVKTFSSFFELAWKISTPFESYKDSKRRTSQNHRLHK
jgi:sugar-specific transcriptional regulator TrmB